MAVELCTDSRSSSRGMSPRISFSHDLNQSDIVPIEPHIPLKTSLLDYDFDFCVSRRSYDQDSSLADELFANGIILPIQIKRKNLPIIKSKSESCSSSSSTTSNLLPPLAPPQTQSSVLNAAETECSKETEDKQNKSSFWKFKRSKSLNCGNIYKRGLCPLPLLSRSKSTGSTASSKRSLFPKDESAHHNHHSNGGLTLKQGSLKNSSQKPPLKKSYGSSFNSGMVQVSPVLNVPTGKLLGFGSIFSNGKDKGKKK